MLLLAFLAALQAAAGAVEAPKAPKPLASTPPRAVVCSSGAVMPAPASRPTDKAERGPVISSGTVNKLADQPDAYMIRTVWRNYCTEADVLMANVTERLSKKPAKPVGK